MLSFHIQNSSDTRLQQQQRRQAINTPSSPRPGPLITVEITHRSQETDPEYRLQSEVAVPVPKNRTINLVPCEFCRRRLYATGLVFWHM